MNLLATVALYVSAVSFIALWFGYINYFYRDFGSYLTGVLDSIRWSTSILIIVFPVFILLSWLLGREFKHEPGKRETKIRKWLIYLTLFVSAVTIIIDLVTLVYNFTGGGLTTSFFLKIAIVLAVAGAIFGYELWDLKRTETRSSKARVFAWLSSAIVLATIVASFVIVGSPAVQRQRRFDERRVSELQVIQNETINYWLRHNKLPQLPDDIEKDQTGFIHPHDPETGLEYEYKITKTAPPTFELCAVFDQPSLETDQRYIQRAVTPEGYLYGQDVWKHDAGKQCFTKVIDPTIYRPEKGVPIPVPVK